MIGAGYCRTMARYNAWQNGQLAGYLRELGVEDLARDRGAFFGSILGTINHLYWGDLIWMSRFDGGPGPEVPSARSAEVFDDVERWEAGRTALDQRITAWANGLSDADVAGDFTWYSGASGREITAQKALVLVHFFNHQTHHRGQVHAMLTATGSKAPVSDLAFMPDTD